MNKAEIEEKRKGISKDLGWFLGCTAILFILSWYFKIPLMWKFGLILALTKLILTAIQLILLSRK